jgi:ABC-type multidrug transport system fused ATPase/permease subunit
MADWDDMKLEDKDKNFSFFIQGVKTLWSLIRDKKKLIVMILVLMLFTQFLYLLIPYMMKLVFDALQEIDDQQALTDRIMWLVAAVFCLRIFTTAFVSFLQVPTFFKLSINLENHWPTLAQEKLLYLSSSYHERENTGKKISGIQKGCNNLIDIVDSLYWNLLPPILFLILNLIFVLSMDYRVGLIYLVAIIPTYWLNRKLIHSLIGDWDVWEKKNVVAGGLFCQSLLNVRTVQSFVKEKKEVQAYGKLRREMADLDLAITNKNQRWNFSISVCINFFTTGAIALGLWLLIGKRTSLGTLMFIISTGGGILQNFYQILNSYTNVMRRLVAVKLMKALLDEETEVKNQAPGKTVTDYRGEFKFDRVTFRYGEKKDPVLKDLYLEFASNKMTALVAKSGEGKTTIIRLLSRMFEVTEGRVMLDGRDIRDFDLFWYRSLFAIVQQDVEIFDASIKENIVYPYAGATDEQIERSLRASDLNEVLANKEKFVDGLQTQVGEKGVKLSGGERQRVGIARAYIALLNGARVLILDEATSNLDSEAERAIQKMLEQIRREMNISIVAIAHRLSTIQRSDMIYVLDDGRVVEHGDHQKLLSRNGLYAHLVELQKLGNLRE